MIDCDSLYDIILIKYYVPKIPNLFLLKNIIKCVNLSFDA